MGVMGSGVAKQLRDKYPVIYSKYKEKCEKSTPDKLLGECQIVKVSDNEEKFVANLFGQKNYGNDGKQYTSTSDFEDALYKLMTSAKSFGYSVALPYKIASDRGGASWDEVYEIIDRVFDDYKVTLYKLEVKK